MVKNYVSTEKFDFNVFSPHTKSWSVKIIFFTFYNLINIVLRHKNILSITFDIFTNFVFLRNVSLLLQKYVSSPHSF